MSRDGCGCLEEFVHGRSARLFKLIAVGSQAIGVTTVPVGRVPAGVGTDPQTRLSGCSGRGPDHIHC